MQRTLIVGREYKDEFCMQIGSKSLDISENNNLISVNIYFCDFKEINDFIYNFIIKTYIKKYISRCIFSQMIGFNSQEQEIIYNEVCLGLNSKIYINNISKITASSSMINLEGVFNFALSDIRDEIKDLCLIKIDELILKNEYLDFIRVLRFFSSVNYGSVGTLHVYIRDDKSADIYDENFNIYDNCRENKYMCELSTLNDFFEYDELIATLVEASPRNIVVHNGYSVSDNDIIETLINIFDDRVSFCTGCYFCKNEDKK